MHSLPKLRGCAAARSTEYYLIFSAHGVWGEEASQQADRGWLVSLENRGESRGVYMREYGAICLFGVLLLSFIVYFASKLKILFVCVSAPAEAINWTSFRGLLL